MRSPAAAGTDQSRLLLAIGAAAFSVIGVGMVMVAAFVLAAMVVARMAGSGGIGSVSPGLSVAIVTILMLIYVAAAGVVALRVFRMVRAGHPPPASPE